MNEKSQVLVTGSAGQLGHELTQLLGERAIAWDRTELDLTQLESIVPKVESCRPGWVINCAAYTAVDLAEDEAEQTRRINAEAVRRLAEACNKIGAALVQVSTDYVFGQADPIRVPRTETDQVSPQGVYAQTKYQGEQAAAEAAEHLVVRTCGLYAGGPGQKNFVETMLRLASQRDEVRVVADQACTPSYAKHVAQGILDLMHHNQRGLFHVVNRGEATWFDFAQKIFHLAGLPTKVVPITTAEFAAKAPRPVYSVLSTDKFEAAGCRPLPTWDEALAEYLIERKAGLAAQE